MSRSNILRDALMVAPFKVALLIASMVAVAVLVVDGEIGDAKAQSAPTAHAVSREREPIVELHGERLWRYRFAPVYRRFDELILKIRGMTSASGRRLLVTLERRPMASGGDNGNQVTYYRLPHRPRENGTLRAKLRLGERANPLPVGRYSLMIWHERSKGYELVAQKPLFLIFNAHDPLDEDVYLPYALPWLQPELGMVQIVSQDFALRSWDLDIHDAQVFTLAMRLIDGTRTGDAAAIRLVEGVFEHVDGYWPELVSQAAQSLEDYDWASELGWSAGQLTSATQRIASDDTRGQCFDYTMLYVALLRSVGIPARTVTITEPGPMPHPYDPDQEVVWKYHVWAEVALRGKWWASDLSYLDNPGGDFLSPGYYSGLQPPYGSWFTRALGRESRLWTVEHNEIREISGRYGVLEGRWGQ